MKLIIQIPCLNEEDQLPLSLGALPRAVEGFDEVEWLVIDDGSDDRTVEVARELGVDHIVGFPKNRGLAAAFQAGLDAALKLGADVIVNTDADNQYDAASIPDLVAPILRGEADLVIGDRDVRTVQQFSFAKKRLQVLGSWVVRKASNTTVPDTTSGFRAYTREAALQLTVVSPYTYTIESIIQAGKARTAIAHVPIGTNPKARESRLFSSSWEYMRRNAGSITRIFAAYEPIKFFGVISALLLIGSAVAFTPFMYDWIANGDRSGHIQSIVVGAMLGVASLQVFVLAIVADMLRNQRVVSQRTLERIRRLELEVSIPPSQYIHTGSIHSRTPGTPPEPTEAVGDRAPERRPAPPRAEADVGQ